MCEAERGATAPENGDDHSAESGSEAIQFSSLRPTAHGFSQRRLLNWASVVVGIVVLLALAIHWLPGMLTRTDSPRTYTRASYNAALGLAPGTGWKPIGPDWAYDISFTGDDRLAYSCGAYPPNPNIFFGVYNVAQRQWNTLTSLATNAVACRVSVAPTDPADVVLITYPTTPSITSRVYRTFDGGQTWKELALPRPAIIPDVAWTNRATLLLVALDLQPEGPATAPNFSLLASYDNGPLAVIPAKQMLGHAAQFEQIGIESSGTTLYATLQGKDCSSYCVTLVRSSDDGRDWTRLPPTYHGDPIVLSAAQPNTSALIGWAFQSDTSVILLRSDDGGTTWHELPTLPISPSGGLASLYALPDGSVYAWCYAPVNTIYSLRSGASRWQAVATVPEGAALAMQYDVRGHAIALWGQMRQQTGSAIMPGLEYYPLLSGAP